ncbi:MAG: maleylpyruvate isomerase family mycothiol-dependent enzyme [Ilumatobacteraceae bacterium]
MIPTHSIDQLAETWASIIELGTGLTEAQWKSPTDLPGWTVQDNLAHLIGTERMLQGLPRTEHLCEPGPHVRNDLGRMTEVEVDARRGCTGAEVFKEFSDLVELRLATLRAGDDDYFATPSMTPGGQADVATFHMFRSLDNWLHEQDMRRALGVPGHLGGPAAEHTVDRLILTIPIVVGKRAGTPEGGAVEITITGDVARHVIAEVDGGRAKVVPVPSAAPLAAITMDTETFVVLACGRRTAAELADRITSTGDLALATKVVENFNMMI